MPLHLQRSRVSFHEFRAPCGSISMADLKDRSEAKSVSLFGGDDNERVR